MVLEQRCAGGLSPEVIERRGAKTLQSYLPCLKQIVVQDLPRDSLAIALATDLSPAISSFVIDPRYSGDNDQGIRGVANGATPFLLAAVSVNAPLDAVP